MFVMQVVLQITHVRYNLLQKKMHTDTFNSKECNQSQFSQVNSLVFFAYQYCFMQKYVYQMIPFIIYSIYPRHNFNQYRISSMMTLDHLPNSINI
jgi:hypothetical protein